MRAQRDHRCPGADRRVAVDRRRRPHSGWYRRECHTVKRRRQPHSFRGLRERHDVDRRRRPEPSELSGVLRLSTDGGNINGIGLAAPHVNAQSGGGDITLTFTRPPANLQISTDGGNITVVLPHGGTGYNVHMSTDSGTSSDQVPSSTSSAHVITATSGGDITISLAS